MYQLKPSSRKQKRGVVMILLVGAIAMVVVMAALTIDRSFMTYRRVQVQEAADMDALATGTLLARDGGEGASAATLAQDEAIGTAIAADNGYSGATPTYPYNSSGGYLQIKVSQIEPLFFSAIAGYSQGLVEAWATAEFQSAIQNAPPPDNMGYITGEGFNYAAYGPQNGSDRGDKIDASLMSMVGGGDPDPGVANPWYGTNSSSSGPFGMADFPYGSVYEFDVPFTYSDGAGGQTLDFEIYDPDMYDSLSHAGPSTYHSGKTWTDPNGRFDEYDHDPTNDVSTAGESGGYASTNFDNTTSYTEDWLYTLWCGQPGQPDSIIIAQAIYGPNFNTASPTGGDDEFNTNDHWATPTGFSINPASYTGTTLNGAVLTTLNLLSTNNYSENLITSTNGETGSWAKFYISVQTSSGVKVNGIYPTGNPKYYGTGYNENGYLVRVGAPHTTLSEQSIEQSTSQEMTDYGVGGKSTAATRTDLMDPYATVPSSTTGATKGETYDTYWEDNYGGPKSGIIFQIDTPMTINANEQSGTAAADIWFGYEAANPVSTGTTALTFWGWDEDSGAESVTYNCYNNASYSGTPVYTETGKIGGNEEWGGTNQLGDIFNIKGYTPGWWEAVYTTGPSDNTTWYANDNFSSGVGSYVNLVSTSGDNNVF